MVNVAMLGASGRMGRTIVPLLYEASDLRLSGALAAAGDSAVGQDAGVIAGMAAVGIVVFGVFMWFWVSGLRVAEFGGAS